MSGTRQLPGFFYPNATNRVTTDYAWGQKLAPIWDRVGYISLSHPSSDGLQILDKIILASNLKKENS